MIELPDNFIETLDKQIEEYSAEPHGNGKACAAALMRVRSDVRAAQLIARAKKNPDMIFKKPENIPDFWDKTSVVSDAAFRAKDLGFSLGTSNFASVIVKALHDAYPPATEDHIKENKRMQAELNGVNQDIEALRNIGRADYKTVYDYTGHIKDINAVVVPRRELRALQLSANRWTGFARSARIRIIGSAGVYETRDGKHVVSKAPENDYVHFGAEFWTKYGDYDVRAGNAEGYTVLCRYADTGYKLAQEKAATDNQELVAETPHGP